MASGVEGGRMEVGSAERGEAAGFGLRGCLAAHSRGLRQADDAGDGVFSGLPLRRVRSWAAPRIAEVRAAVPWRDVQRLPNGPLGTVKFWNRLRRE